MSSFSVAGKGRILSALLVVAAGLGVVVWHTPQWLGIEPGSAQHTFGLQAVTGAGGALVAWLLIALLLGGRLAAAAYWRGLPEHSAASAAKPWSVQQAPLWSQDLKEHLQANYGAFAARKVRIFWVVGEAAQVEAIAPGLVQQRWLEGQGSLLLWGGPAASELPDEMAWVLLKLRSGRPLDGIVWALTGPQLDDTDAMGAGVSRLQHLARTLRWQVPLHFWQVCADLSGQIEQPVEPIGVALSARSSLDDLEHGLQDLLEKLKARGGQQACRETRYHFLLSLCWELREQGIARWRQALLPWLDRLTRTTPLHGVWFSLPQNTGTGSGLAHTLQVDAAWDGVLASPSVRPQRLGWPLMRIARNTVLPVALLCAAGMLLSFNANRQMVAQVQDALLTVQAPQSNTSTADEQFQALYTLMTELDRLAHRGAPWYERFGLSRHQQVLDALLPRYAEASRRLLQEPARVALAQSLDDWLVLPPKSPARAEGAAQAYERLRAYLMLARPDKVDEAFVRRVLGTLPLEPLSPGLWLTLAPRLWQFQAQTLAQRADWPVNLDESLVAEVRQELLRQLGQRNAQASLYQQVLDSAARHYPALALEDLVGEADAGALFKSAAQVPGVYTRQAWDGSIRQAIEKLAQARREQIDWVLSDGPQDIAADLSPEALAEALTARYFHEYAQAWVGFVGSLRWQPARRLDEVIDQLSLIAEPRQSPLLALLNTLVWQGQAGTRSPALGESLLKSAQQLIGQDKTALAEPWMKTDALSGPLDATFGPWRALLGKDSAVQGEQLSLQTWLNRVTRVRLKLQQISQASDPQAMTQVLAQTVLQGKGVDLSDSRAYGQLIAASLGAEWAGAGQTLFVQPLEQAWQRVLQPAAASLNSQWQRSIVTPWEQAFTGRYPFAATDSDASLALLGQMVRADSGRIEQFVQSELGGVLRKEGNRWVVDKEHSQGLRLNPAFVDALNRLSHLSDVLFTDGGLGMGFDLRAKPVRDLVQTTLKLNGATHQYFNQKEFWQRFHWPGNRDYVGVNLRWVGVHSGERLYGEYPGTWGLIRLLEQAQISALDDSNSHYLMQIKAPDGLMLSWHLRTELGAGPMTLLELRGFKLPRQVFLLDGKAQAAVAGRFE